MLPIIARLFCFAWLVVSTAHAQTTQVCLNEVRRECQDRGYVAAEVFPRCVAWKSAAFSPGCAPLLMVLVEYALQMFKLEDEKCRDHSLGQCLLRPDTEACLRQAPLTDLWCQGKRASALRTLARVEDTLRARGMSRGDVVRWVNANFPDSIPPR